jgi:ATP-binding cassette, subfamily C (CFTR/MRP), member 1
LDDVLAAVDSHVARHVFGKSLLPIFIGRKVKVLFALDHAIGPRGILSTKARILVTNSVTFSQHFDQIIYLRRGIIVEEGSYAKLVANSQGELYKLM